MEEKNKKRKDQDQTNENEEKESGKLGGETTLEEYGPEFYSEIDSEDKPRSSENI